MQIKTFKALVSLDVLEGNGKVEFFLVVHTYDTIEARKIAEREYPSGKVRFVIEVGTFAEGFFNGHYKNHDEVYYSESEDDQPSVTTVDLKEKGTKEMKDAIESNLHAIDLYASALDIIKKLGGVIDSTTETNEIFLQVNMKERPDAFDKIVCMTRDLLEHQNSFEFGDYKFLYFGMK